MGTLIALAGRPAIDTPPGAWTSRLGDDLPVALGVETGIGPRVVAATSAEGHLHAVLAGALTNRRELEEVTLRSGTPSGGRNDAALALRLYEGRGEQSVSALRGGFALALWDGRRGRLVLARDQVGAQSLYYAAARNSCAAATRLAPLLRMRDLAGEPDVAFVDVLLSLGTVPGPSTPYPGIRQIRPGELLVWEPGRVRSHRYWQLRFHELREERHTVAREAAQRAREQLEEAVRQRTAGTVTGLLLSDGLGAASVLALAATLDRRPAIALTIGRSEADAHVRAAAARARAAGVEHRVVAPAIDWDRAVERSLAVHGAPIGGMEEALLEPAVATLTAPVRVVLAGGGVEDVLGGGPAERAWAGCERYRATPGLVRECLDILAASGWPRGLAWTVRAARSAPVDILADTELVPPFDARRALYTPDVARLTDAGPTRPLLTALVGDAVSSGATDPRDVLYAVRLAIGAPRVAAGLANAVGVDACLWQPLIDPRIAQMAATIPGRLRAAPAGRARLLDGALAPELPRELRQRAHQPLRPPPAAWREGSLQAVVEDTLAPDRIERLGVFDARAVAHVRARHAAGDAALGEILWRLVLVSRWLERPVRRLADDYSSAPEATSAVIASSS
jgi:asparagine synthase (glutamine-hydrolysing)